MLKAMLAWVDNRIKSAAKKRAEKIKRALPRNWLFVHAYGAQQVRPGYDQTFNEAIDFMRHALQASLVRIDWDNSIIFFDARKTVAQNS